MPAKLLTFESLSLRDFRLLWFGQLSTSLGQWMDQTARSWLVYSLTHSALQLGFVNAIRGIPLLLFGIVAGVMADRYGRKNQLIIAQVSNAVLNIILATLILTGRIEVWHIYTTGFLAGIVQAFQQPARQVMVSDLVGKKHLLNAIALNSAAGNVSRIVGPAICGILIETIGIDMSYYIQGVMYAVATVWTVQIKVPASASPAALNAAGKTAGLARESFFTSVKVGFGYIYTHKVILSLMVLALAPMLLGAPYLTLIPIFAIDVLGGNASTQGLLLTIGGIGAILGALLTATMGRRQGSIKMLIGGAAGYGLSIVLFSRSPVLWMALGSTFLSSLCMAQYQSQNQTIIQVITPSAIRGRVLGVYNLSNALSPVGSMIAGALASALGAPMAVTIMGAACALVALGIAIFARDLWKLNLEAESEKEKTGGANTS
jgi:MFS family permease